MLFGMGMTLTPEEDAELAPIIRPCYSALALANDYFSFDREWEKFQSQPQPQAQAQTSGPPVTNAVWLFTQWHGVSIDRAKYLVRRAANRYEDRFLRMCALFRGPQSRWHCSEKLDKYLRGLTYQIAGNVVWSLNCPRYHPEMRYDPNAGLEDELTVKARRGGWKL